jgi:hypothetical protein
MKYEPSIIECPKCKNSIEENVPKFKDGKAIIKCFFCREIIDVEAWQFEKLD